jgi:protein-disulfide isomerase
LPLATLLALPSCEKKQEPPPSPSAATTVAPAATPSPSAAPAATNAPDASALAPFLPDAGLTAREEADLAGALSRFPAPCPSLAVSVAQCLTEERACPACGLAARYVAIGVRDGWPRQAIDMAYSARFDPAGALKLPVDGSPTKGPDLAPVTIVEFGSYLCSHCAAEAPRLDALLKAHPKDVRLVFKPVWSPSSPGAVPPSRASLAAAAQGKFWEMHALLLANQPQFADADIDGYAAQLGLDVAKLHADMQGSKVAQQMARDLALERAAGFDELPAIYINGRPYQSFEELGQRVEFEIMAAKAKE